MCVCGSLKRLTLGEVEVLYLPMLIVCTVDLRGQIRLAEALGSEDYDLAAELDEEMVQVNRWFNFEIMSTPPPPVTSSLTSSSLCDIIDDVTM